MGDNPESYVLGKDYFTNDSLFHGMKGEEVINSAMRKAFPTWHIKHNPFGSQYRYACSKGIDNTATKEGYLPICSEVKNLKDQNKPYGTDFVIRHVLPRFNGLYGVKVLFITFMHLLTLEARQLLKRHGIITIEIGERLTTEFFKQYEKVYQLANKIKRMVQPKPKALVVRPILSVNPLVVGQVSVNPVAMNKNNYTIRSIDIDSHIVSSNPVIALLQEARRIKLWQESCKEHGLNIDN